MAAKLSFFPPYSRIKYENEPWLAINEQDSVQLVKTLSKRFGLKILCSKEILGQTKKCWV